MENFSTINKLVHIFSSEGRVVWVRLERMNEWDHRVHILALEPRGPPEGLDVGDEAIIINGQGFLVWVVPFIDRPREVGDQGLCGRLMPSLLYTPQRGSRLVITVTAPPRSEPEGPWGPKAMQRGKISNGVWQLSSWWFRMKSRVVWLQRSVFQVEGWWINWAECYWEAKWGKVRYRWNIHENWPGTRE